jgi:hypothetical protein
LQHIGKRSFITENLVFYALLRKFSMFFVTPKPHSVDPKICQSDSLQTTRTTVLLLYLLLRLGLQNQIIPSGFSRKFSFPPSHVVAPKNRAKFVPFKLEHINLCLNPTLHCYLVVSYENVYIQSILRSKKSYFFLQGLVLTVIPVSSERCVKLRNV